MPGGKLVVADLEIVEGRLERVVVSGDFFLDPDEALEAINAALTGLAADTDAAALAQHLSRVSLQGRELRSPAVFAAAESGDLPYRAL